MILSVAILELLAAALAACFPPQTPTDASLGPIPRDLVRLPLAFVENQGQWDTPARFVARRGPLVARAEPGALVLQLEQRSAGGSGRALVARLVFEGASEDAELLGLEPQGGVRNYLVGERERWRTHVPAYSRVLYRRLHEGIDLQLRERAGRLEYDLLLAPEAELERFVVRCEGVLGLELDEDGSLVMQTSMGPLRHSPPDTWQVLPDGERHGLSCRFVLLDGERFGFALEDRLEGLPVVIDPGLEWSTCLGGSSDDWAMAGAVGSSGLVAVGGATTSGDFPGASGALQGPMDAFVTVLDPSATGTGQLVWTTVLGGSAEEKVLDLELDAAGHVFAAGSTRSADLATTADAYDGTANGDWDAFVCELDGGDGSILYLSYLGGSGMDAGAELELQAPRTVTIAGPTASADLQMVGSFQAALGGSRDYYLARLDLDQPPAAQLSYSTYLGGVDHEGFPEDVLSNSFGMDLQVLPSGALALTGISWSADFPTTPNAYDPAKGNLTDAVVTILDPSQAGAAGLSYSTFLGGSGATEGGIAVEVDDAGVVTVGGFTLSQDFPTTAGAFDTTSFGDQDAFVARLDPSLGPPYDEQLLYSTFLGSLGAESVTGLVRDPSGAVLAAGFVGSAGQTTSGFPTTCGAFDESFNGEQDGFLVYLSPSGHGASDLLYSTFVGGAGWEIPAALDAVSSHPLRVLAAGATDSADFPTTHPYQTHQGARDGFAFRLEVNPHTTCAAAGNSAGTDGALICATGSVAIADNTFTLNVSGATPGDNGLFFYGSSSTMTPFGDGYLCVGSPVFRLLPAIQIDPGGNASRLLDFTQPPAGSGPGAITPGSTWFFQLWYRDPKAAASGFNLSNGLEATFYP